jgi:hypothetical protein
VSDFIEGVVDAIYDRITSAVATTLSTRITAINTEKDDGLTLAAIADADVYKGYYSLPPKYPCIIIDGDTSEGWEPSTDSLDCYHIIDIVVLMTEDDPAQLNQGMWRYLRALTEHLFADWDLGDGVDKLDFLGHYYDWMEITRDDSVALLRAGVLRIRAYLEVAI